MCVWCFTATQSLSPNPHSSLVLGFQSHPITGNAYSLEKPKCRHRLPMEPCGRGSDRTKDGVYVAAYRNSKMLVTLREG